MGGSSYSDDHYRSRAYDRAKSGTPTFHYDHHVKSNPTAPKVAHADLDPKGKTRESRDSDAHPESVAIGVIFDETGSMGQNPIELQKKLPTLMGLLLRNSYLEHPQILFGAVGDFHSDQVPLQIGQFESGIEMDDDIGKIYLEGNGGGQEKESYGLALYFFARHTSIDCFEKRGKKGYLFIVGDEKPYPAVTREEVAKVCGDTIEHDIPIEKIIAEVQERYHLFFILPRSGSSYGTQFKARWQELVGAENVLELDKSEAVCETIGTTIGLIEGAIGGVDDIAADLHKAGADRGIVASVTSALDPLARSTALAKAGSGNLPERAAPSGKSERL